MKSLLLALLVVTGAAQASNNWTGLAGPVTNSTGLCWRNSAWTPATAETNCDGATQPAITKSVEPVVVPKVEKSVAIVQLPPVTYLAQSLFDFDRAVIKPQGLHTLDQLVKRLKLVHVDTVIVVGHTDSVGTDAYNMRLGQRRARAVADYLIGQGIEANRVFADSKGEREPASTNSTAYGRSMNRRVVVEVYGTAD